MIAAGELIHPIAIQAKDQPVPKDASGAERPTWSTVKETHAKITTAGGKEFYRAQQVNVELSHVVTIRRRAYTPLTPSHRLLFGTRIFDINYIINVDERNIDLELFCKELV